MAVFGGGDGGIMVGLKQRSRVIVLPILEQTFNNTNLKPEQCLSVVLGLKHSFSVVLRPNVREGTFLIGEGQTCFLRNRGRITVFWQGKNYSMSVS